jgi:hypothetical protein
MAERFNDAASSLRVDMSVLVKRFNLRDEQGDEDKMERRVFCWKQPAGKAEWRP